MELLDKNQNDFSEWIKPIGKSLKNNLLYKQPITIIVFILVICFPGKQMNPGVNGKILGCALFLIFYCSIIVYPIARNSKVFSHIIVDIEIYNNNCKISYNNIFRKETTIDSYDLDQIRIGEKEVYHEKIFRSEKFMVLDIENKKFYLIGDLLTEFGSIFTDKKKSYKLLQ